MKEILDRHFLPFQVILFLDEKTDLPKLVSLAPFVKSYLPPAKKTQCYVCQNYQCKLPTDAPQKLKELLKIK